MLISNKKLLNKNLLYLFFVDNNLNENQVTFLEHAIYKNKYRLTCYEITVSKLVELTFNYNEFDSHLVPNICAQKFS